MKDFKALQEKALEFNSVLVLPVWESSMEAIEASIRDAMEQAGSRLNHIGKLKKNERNFRNTLAELDDIHHQAGMVARRVNLIKEAHPDSGMREKATNMIKVFEDWAVGVEYREDVYIAISEFAATSPHLEGEDARLLEDVLRDYRRAGMDLPAKSREEVERLRKELVRTETDFDRNINNAQHLLSFTRDELEGVPEAFLRMPGIPSGEDKYTIQANVTWQCVTVMENAVRDETRSRLEKARFNLARKENTPLIKHILDLRRRIAVLLGYVSWADFQVETRMAKTATTAMNFLMDLELKLQPKLDSELRELKELKARSGMIDSQIHLRDWRFYANKLKREKFDVDTEALRVYFPYEQVLQGMFSIYQRIFSIRIEEMDTPQRWVEDLKLYAVTDVETGEPLGAFYLDMFPREGKFNHYAQFSMIPGKEHPDGKYQRPVVALLCNFPLPEEGKPSLLSHNEVETLFHEFGHALHSIFTRARYSRFSGTSVPRDFVEAPSQMLENWVWDKNVLDSFASDYRDSSRKIPQPILQKMKDARLSSIACFYRRQIAFALMDLVLHTEYPEDPVARANEIFSEVFLPVPGDTAYLAYFGHFNGYDAGYYGYAWAEAIAADMATVFENSKDGYFDVEAGRSLRKEIYEPGDSREVAISIEKFLGRPRSITPFLKTLGITEQG